MTNTTKPTRRETFTEIRERGKLRPIVIELRSTFVTMRLKGTKREYTATYEQLWTVGAANAARQAAREKLEEKELKKVTK